MDHSALHRVAIIGAGISGLAAAHRLVELQQARGSSLALSLIDASTRTGGIIRSERRDGFLLEAGPDSFVTDKPDALNLARAIGLEGELLETNSTRRRSFVVGAGKLRAVPEGFHLLAPARLLPFALSDIFTLRGKARMALDLLLPRRTDEVDESLAEFVRRRLGQEALERMAQPMVGGIYTADPERLSLRATMPRFIEMERRHRSIISALWQQRRGSPQAHQNGTSGARYSLFMSFAEGMETLTRRLTELLPEGVLRLGTGVRRVTREPATNRWQIELGDGEVLLADALLLALPAYAAAELLRDTDALLATELSAIEYASTATLSLAFKRADIAHKLDGFGFVVPRIEKRSLLACTFCHVKYPGRAADGYALLRAFVGGALQPEMFALAEDEMVAAVRTDLQQLLGIEKPPLFHQLSRWPRSMAQYHIGHQERVKRIRTRLQLHSGLALTGGAYDGAGIPDCIRAAHSAAENILALLTQSKLLSEAH